MRNVATLLFFFSFLVGCTSTDQTTVLPTVTTDTVQSNTSTDDNAGFSVNESEVEKVSIPQPQKIKNPSGIYSVTIPSAHERQQTIKFFANNQFQLQEKYENAQDDSIVITHGTWAPSNGFIWLYRDNVAWGRYKWQGNNLAYFNPENGKTVPMEKLIDVMDTKAWQQKLAEKVAVYGIGTEPFWSIEHRVGDTLSFLLADKGAPINLKLFNRTIVADSTIYLAGNDSMQLKMVVLPFFCSDGMSDHVYQNKILVQFNNQKFTGCGVAYR
ncbi:MAG: hypothetical protein V4676_12900 [Bacteroidota bacterium]